MRGEYGLNLVDAIILVKMWLQLKRLYRWIIIAIENFIFFGFFPGGWLNRSACSALFVLLASKSPKGNLCNLIILLKFGYLSFWRWYIIGGSKLFWKKYISLRILMWIIEKKRNFSLCLNPWDIRVGRPARHIVLLASKILGDRKHGFTT